MYKKLMFFVILIVFLMAPSVLAEENDIKKGDIGILTNDFDRVRVANLNTISNGLKDFNLGDEGVVKRNGLVKAIAVNGEVLVVYTPPKGFLLTDQLPKNTNFIVSTSDFQWMVKEYKRIQEEKRKNTNPVPDPEKEKRKQELKKKVEFLLNGNYK